MARLSDLSLKNRLFMGTYRYRTVAPLPWARPRRPLREARVALVSTGGVFAPGQAPFDEEKKGGDVSFRVIRSEADVAVLGIAHRSDAFDQDGFRKDRNLGFPLDRLREMAGAGAIGGLSPRAISFMGSISAPLRLVKETAPAAADVLEEDGADVALLVPLWPLCHQTVCLIAAELERRGIATTSVTALPEITRKVGIPRALEVPYELGYPLGLPSDAALQTRILERAFALLDEPGPPPAFASF